MLGGCFDGGSSSGSKERQVEHQVNDSLFELHKPEGTPSMEIVLFHGLNLGESSDAHLSTWEAEDGSIWPQKWLVEEYPAAHIFTASYSGSVGKTSCEIFDMYIIVENLMSDLRKANIGQTPYCPVVLVGHCFGGLVIKQLCLESRKLIFSRKGDERAKAQSFLNNVRGIFYYGTPDHGSPLISPQADERNSTLLKYFRILSTEAERLNFEFDRLRRSYPKWRVGGLGESLPTESGVFHGVVAAAEASSRQGDFFSVDAADPISISKPSSKKDRRFYSFTRFLETIARNLEEEGRKQEKAVGQEARPHNFQCLLEGMVNVDVELDQIMSNMATLNHLKFHHCSFQTLPRSVGYLANLNHLEFHNCHALQTLPDSFGDLATLNHLEFHNCEKLQILPNSFGQLAFLNHLEFHNCDKLQTLPDSFGHLPTLNSLEFHYCCLLQTLPDSFGQLVTLNHLEFHNCNELQTLPDSFGHLATLNHLEFHHCQRLQTLPDSFGHLATTLNHLEFHNCNKLQTLPNSFRHLGTVNHVLKWDCGDTDSEGDSEQEFRRFITEVTDKGANGYFVSKIWLSSLDKHHREKVMSVLGGAGYFEIYQTQTTMFYERIEDEMQASTICDDSETDDTKANFPNSQTNQGETFSRSNNGNLVGEAGSSTASQGSGDSLRDDLQSMGIAAKVSGVKNATEASPKINAKCECPLQRLTVSMRREAGPSTSSSQVEVTIPEREQFNVFTRVTKDISMKAMNTETGSLEVDVPLTVSTEIGLRCCVTSDHKNVRIQFLEILGEVRGRGDFNRRTNALALKSVRTNVNASINPGPENIHLNIEGNNGPAPWRMVLADYRPLDNNDQRKEDLMWLDLTGKRPKNSTPGSKTLELQQHVKNRLKIDRGEVSHRALLLYFGENLPVTFEGDILGDLDPNSFLELHIRHEVDISYVPCDPRPTADAISTVTERRNKEVEFDCVLEFRTQTFSS